MVTCCLLQPDVVKPGIIVQGILLDLCLILEAPLTYYDILQRPSTEAQCGQHQQYNMPVSARHQQYNMPVSARHQQQLTDHQQVPMSQAPAAYCQQPSSTQCNMQLWEMRTMLQMASGASRPSDFYEGTEHVLQQT